MKLFTIMLALMAVGCTHKRDYIQLTDQIAETGLSKIVDKKTGNVCYLYVDGDGTRMNCLK